MARVMENVSGLWWTEQDEMIADLEALEYEVLEVNDEYVTVLDTLADVEIIFYLGHANRTMWIERFKEV